MASSSNKFRNGIGVNPLKANLRPRHIKQGRQLRLWAYLFIFLSKPSLHIHATDLLEDKKKKKDDTLALKIYINK